MTPSLTLAWQEVRANRARNLIKGLILFCAIGTQLFTSLVAAASEDAVARYGAALFGYDRTYSADLPAPPSLAQLGTMDATLDAEAGAHPRAALALLVTTSADLTSAKVPVRGPETTMTVASVHGAWTRISAAMARAQVFREVSDLRAPPRLVVSGRTATQLGVDPTSLVTPTAPSPPPAQGGQPDEWAQTLGSLAGIPAYRGPAEPNKALTQEVLASRSVLTLLGAAPAAAAVYWRCTPADCSDAEGIARDIARTAGLSLGDANRIDSRDEIEPVLRQQRGQGSLFALVALTLGGLAVAVVATAMVEARTPELVTLRTLGAKRSTLVATALLEGLVVATVVGLLSMLVSLALARFDPNVLNHIDGIELEAFRPPLGVYLRATVTTLVVGLATGLFPAARAYRLIRAR